MQNANLKIDQNEKITNYNTVHNKIQLTTQNAKLATGNWQRWLQQV